MSKIRCGDCLDMLIGSTGRHIEVQHGLPQSPAACGGFICNFEGSYKAPGWSQMVSVGSKKTRLLVLLFLGLH